jgi:hypothetical protein
MPINTAPLGTARSSAIGDPFGVGPRVSTRHRLADLARREVHDSHLPADQRPGVAGDAELLRPICGPKSTFSLNAGLRASG